MTTELATLRHLEAIAAELDSLRRREAELAAEYEVDRAAYESGNAETGALLNRAFDRLNETLRLNVRRWHLLCQMDEVGTKNGLYYQPD